MEIDGAAASDNAGNAVAGAGNVGGTSTADLLVGARFAANNGGNSGSAYVIYGQKCVTPLPAACADVYDPADVNLANITTTQDYRGSRIDGAAQGDRAGPQVVADPVGQGSEDGSTQPLEDLHGAGAGTQPVLARNDDLPGARLGRRGGSGGQQRGSRKHGTARDGRHKPNIAQ